MLVNFNLVQSLELSRRQSDYRTERFALTEISSFSLRAEGGFDLNQRVECDYVRVFLCATIWRDDDTSFTDENRAALMRNLLLQSMLERAFWLANGSEIGKELAVVVNHDEEMRTWCQDRYCLACGAIWGWWWNLWGADMDFTWDSKRVDRNVHYYVVERKCDQRSSDSTTWVASKSCLRTDNIRVFLARITQTGLNHPFFEFREKQIM